MGYFKKQDMLKPDATVTITILGNIVVLAQVWIQPIDASVGIMSNILEEYKLLNPDTREEVDSTTYSQLDDYIKEQIKLALRRKGVEVVY